MQSPLALNSRGKRIAYAGTCLCAALLAFVLFGAVTAQGQESTAAAFELYPRALDIQLRRIVESPANEAQPLREVCTDLLKGLNAIVVHLERTPTEPCHELCHFEETVKIFETIRTSWTIKNSVEEPYIPSAIALDEIFQALLRRIYVWKSLLLAEVAEATPLTILYEKCFDDVERLKERTLAVEQYFARARRVIHYRPGQTLRDYLETQSWLIELEACRQPAAQPVRLVSLSTPSISVEILKIFSDRANATIQRLESPTLTNEQRAFLNHPTVNTWKEELQSWAADTVAPIHVLQFLEQYEVTGGMSDMRALSRFIDQLSRSKTAEYRQLADLVRRQYGMANVRLFLSSPLLNNHLPPAVSETVSFRDVIQSQPTIGRRQTETEFAISFVPHPTRVLTSLDIGVDLATVSRSDAFATQLFNTGRTLVVARKKIELTEQGFLTEPCEARIVGHHMRLFRMNTEFDGVPVLSGLLRGVVLNQYESRVPDARTEVQRKILRQVRNHVDRETEQRLQPINEKIREFTQHADEEFDLRIERRDSQTEEQWLVTAWGITSKDALLSSTPAPETQYGSFADLKIHESLPNMLIAKLELEGKRGTVSDFKEMLAEKFQQPALAAPGENDDVAITFAPYNPVVVRFVDGRAELTISIAALRLGRQTYRNFKAIVRYKPAYDSSGRLVLERDDYIGLLNVLNVREQFVMRTAFGKIFPVSRHVPLVPKVLESDPQFDYLTTGHCRIERGWFALALVEKPDSVEPFLTFTK